jgi:RNA polymerase sigma-32 factor
MVTNKKKKTKASLKSTKRQKRSEEKKLEQELFPVPKSQGNKAPVVYDPLKHYLREISRYPLLTPEEEKQLTWRYYDNKDPDAALKLVVSNLRLVVKIALEYHKMLYFNLLDLIQEGNVGLMQAVKKFDPKRGIRLMSYAQFWIRAYILKYIINNYKLVKVGTTQNQRKLFFNLKKAKESLEKLGFDPQPKLLADTLNVKESEIIEMDRRLSSSEISLDTPIDEEQKTLYSVFPSQDESVETSIAREELKEFMQQKAEAFVKTLSEKEQMIWNDRIMAENPASLQSIGDRLGVTKERVRQIEKKIYEKFRAFIQDEIPSLDTVI